MSNEKRVRAFPLFPVVAKQLMEKGTLSKDELLEQITKDFHDTPRKNGSSNLRYMASWALTYGKAIGFMVNPDRGIWEMTEKGRIHNWDDKDANLRAWKGAAKKMRIKRGARKKTQTEKPEQLQEQGQKGTASYMNEQIRNVLNLETMGALPKNDAYDAIKRLLAIAAPPSAENQREDRTTLHWQ